MTSDLLQRNNMLKQAKKFIPGLTIIAQRSRLQHNEYGTSQRYIFSIITKRGKYTSIFTDSIHNHKHNIPINFDDILYSWIIDAECFENSKDFDDFCLQFGYDFKNYDEYNTKYIVEKHKAEKAYQVCKYAYRKMNELLTDIQIEKLHDLFQDY